MTFNNLCDSCINIGCIFQSGIIRTQCAFYIPPHIKPDNSGHYVVMQPIAEATPKDYYEARLKADEVLDKIKGYVDHIRHTGMGKEKSLKFIEKFIEGLKEENEVQDANSDRDIR